MDTRLPTLNLGPQVEAVAPQELFEVLVAACSHSQQQIDAAGRRLKQMLEMTGTYNELHNIASQRGVPLAVRQQAIIQFKLAALHHWKSRKLLNDAERMQIRNRCMTFLDEPDDTIAQFNAFIVAKIARNDLPSQWPTLLTDIVTLIENGLRQRFELSSRDPHQLLLLRRSLQVVNSTLKELASAKMLNGVKTMAIVVGQIKQIFLEYYAKISNYFSPEALAATADPNKFYEDVLIGHLTFKCVTKMGVWLWHRIDKHSAQEMEQNQAWISHLVQNSVQQVQNLVVVRKTMVTARQQNPSLENYLPAIKILTKHLLAFGKFFRRLQQLSHQRFASLPMCGDLVLFYWSQIVEATEALSQTADSDEVLYPVRFLVQGMVLFKENLAQWSVVRRDGTPNKNSLSKDFVQNAVKLLITKFMPLKPSDLESWMEDPEEWLNDEDRENEQWDFEIRACSERVLVQLSNQFPDVVSPLLITTFNEVAPQPSETLDAILQKEALYCAIGRCAIRLKDQLPFERWLDTSLTLEARSENPSYPIIKRRIAWVLGRWVSEQCSSPNIPRIWDILVHLLKDSGPGSDTVVRLTAVTALKECIDTLEFAADEFVSYLPEAVDELIRLIDVTDASESKRRVANSLSALMEQMGNRVTPYMDGIAAPLPKIWTSCGEDWLLKGTLLGLVTKLVEAVRERSSSLNELTIPLIQESLSDRVMTHLDEDGLILWSSTLRNATSLSSPTGGRSLQELFPRALYLLATNLDLLGKITSVVESYFILDAPALLQFYANDIFRAFLEALKSPALSINIKDMVISLGFLVQLAPSSLWGEPLHTSGLFAHLLLTLNEGESGSLLLTEIIYLFSRIVMADRHMFLQLMSATAAATNQIENNLYDRLLDQWWGKFDNMSEPRHRKLTAMGIAALVSTGHSEVLKRLSGEIFNLWLDVFGEIKETVQQNEEDPTSLSLISPTNLRRHWELDEAPAAYYQDSEGTIEYDRRKALYDRDPVRTVQLNAYVGAQLRDAEAAAGPSFQLYLKDADPTVMKQIQDELTST
ncbi:ran binding protein 11 [Coprinopsis marcescibilis]|uniref:Ran binding protein 11 n=1 Tax=Coprinopsis marcescibilis TaxID=230819 RepID=A0A5C3L9B3_COPMA|nr:ran binding protein 11 [Coprinopsis marcescibilis]